MPVDDALLFIDTNKYLDLYRTDKGMKLLAPLGEQVGYIFVTQMVVDEVQRNKILVAADFLSQKFKELKLQTFNVPDHLSGTSTNQGIEILKNMREIVQKIKNANDKVDDFALGIIQQISHSEDEVSKALAPIFAKAVPHTPEELQRARSRRELGNPPGKAASLIGDQLTWEQVLTHFKGKRRLWIISRDGDYGTVYGGKGFLNRFLFDELCKVASLPEVYLFEDLVEGIEHFVKTTGVKAEKRLTPEEAQEVEKEERSLPHLIKPSYDVHGTMANLARFSQWNEDLRTMLVKPFDYLYREEDLRRAMAEMSKRNQIIEVASRAMDGLYQPPAPAHRSPKGDTEKKDEQPPTSPRKGENEEENEEGKAG